jgi:hypothetical protein
LPDAPRTHEHRPRSWWPSRVRRAILPDFTATAGRRYASLPACIVPAEQAFEHLPSDAEKQAASEHNGTENHGERNP